MRCWSGARRASGAPHAARLGAWSGTATRASRPPTWRAAVPHSPSAPVAGRAAGVARRCRLRARLRAPGDGAGRRGLRGPRGAPGGERCAERDPRRPPPSTPSSYRHDVRQLPPRDHGKPVPYHRPHHSPRPASRHAPGTPLRYLIARRGSAPLPLSGRRPRDRRAITGPLAGTAAAATRGAARRPRDRKSS